MASKKESVDIQFFRSDTYFQSASGERGVQICLAGKVDRKKYIMFQASDEEEPTRVKAEYDDDDGKRNRYFSSMQEAQEYLDNNVGYDVFTLSSQSGSELMYLLQQRIHQRVTEKLLKAYRMAVEQYQMLHSGVKKDVHKEALASLTILRGGCK